MAALGAVALLAAAAPAAHAADGQDLAGTRALRRAVDVNGVLAHERQFQKIANDNRLFGVATRAAGTPGYEQSVRYVITTMRQAGYRVTVQRFTVPFFVAGKRSLAVTPKPRGFVGTATVLQFSGGGTVTGRVQAVDVVVPIGARPVNTSTSGCEASDFARFVRGNIALVQRGRCTFAQKVDNAVAAGARAVLLFNEGQPGRTAPIDGTLSRPKSIPVLELSYADGAALVAQVRAGGATSARLSVAVQVDPARPTFNVVAESRGGNPANVVMAGAHLDSVPPGPGINDNGSGSATLLEVARQMARIGVKPTNRVRFAWWGGEELGLLGSTYYVKTLSPAARSAIALYLNFDMVGSPNFVRFVYDGDNSTFRRTKGTAPAPAGSGAIEKMFTGYFAAKGLRTEPTAFDGRSDYGPFTAVGIPAGGLFTGAENVKTPAQSSVYGGTAGKPTDACYHQACDDLSNLNRTALDQMSDAVAHAMLTYARDTSSVRPSRRT
ncbi:MAG TPA: M28 family metallopeptidase [Mycobacteriales bacterium]|nr:M28 family metallopeptidase [Mycobacteriales bacterium]